MNDNVLEKIYKSSLKLLVKATLEETYKTIIDEAIKLVGAENGTIYLSINKEFKTVYTTIEEFYEVKPRKGFNSYRAFRTGKPIIADFSNIGKVYPTLKKYQFQSAVFIPLSYHDKSIGVMVVSTASKVFFDDKKLQILVYFGAMASLAIRKAQLYDEVKKALETRDFFMSMASHELKTPITSINGYAQLLFTKLSGANTQESRWVEQLTWECQRLTNLVKELLATNQIDVGELQYNWKECSLLSILTRSISNSKIIYPDRKIVFKSYINGEGDMIIGDFDKLIQAVSNLIENASKFSNPETKIHLLLKYNKPFLTLKIEDKGIGIDKKDLPNIFNKYYMSDHHKKEGMGIGLFLAKEIIERHHGSIKIYTKVKKGTKVEVKFPLAKK